MKKNFIILLLLIAGIFYNADLGENVIPGTNCYAGVYSEYQTEEDTLVVYEVKIPFKAYTIIHNNPFLSLPDKHFSIWKPPVNS